MEENKASWLPHLSSVIVSDAIGYELDAYALALEGWRRGLVLKWHIKDSEKFSEMKTWFVERPGKLFSLSSKDRTHYFFRTRGDKVANEAVEIGGDKELTKTWLTKAGVNVPKGKRFAEGVTLEELMDTVSSIGYPLVIKPTDGSYGRGVVTNIQNEDELKGALQYVQNQLQYTDILVEQYINGEDYRLYVVGDKVEGAIKRIPANVVGDGESSIRVLIERKNEKRQMNPRLTSCLIKVDEEIEQYLSSRGFSLESIPEKGETVYLIDKSNISIGGDSVDCLDELPNEIKDTAVRALQAIPGLPHGAVDIMVEHGKPDETAAVVLELNPTAQIGSLLFPMKGKARDIPSAIIDFYFPETKGLNTDKGKLYFDFSDVLEPLVSRTATVTTVSMAPIGKIYGKKYTVTGDVQSIDFHRGLRKQAFERKLSGFVKNLINGNIEVVVIGTDLEMVNDFKRALLEDPERSSVNEITEELWDRPVKVGFEVKGDMKTQIEQIRKMTEELEVLSNELKNTERKYRRYINSLTWKMTLPLRKVSDFFKFISR